MHYQLQTTMFVLEQCYIWYRR